MKEELLTPAVVVDLEIAEKNIKDMVTLLAQYNIVHRPHIKAHKSVYFAKKQLEAGCKGITCAKITEAEVMASHGIKDILIAFPIIGEAKLKRLGTLMEKTEVITIVNSIEGAKGVSDMCIAANKKIKTLIEVDGGINRGGIMPGAPVVHFAKQIEGFLGLTICGLMYYGGTIYEENTKEGLSKKTKEEHDALMETKKLLQDEGFSISILSTGSSYSARYPHCLEGVTEVRAGNYIFNDGASLWAGIVTKEDCAMRIFSTVVSKPDEMTAILDAGSKTLTSDMGAFTQGYGYVIGYEEGRIYKLNEEHGFFHTEKPNNLKVGDMVEIIPNHACVIANLNNEIYGMRNGELEEIIQIEARGMNR